MILARFESDSSDGDNGPNSFKGYYIDVSWVIGKITGAFIESIDIAHLLSFNTNKATLTKIDFSKDNITFKRPLPATISSLYSTVFISEAQYYSLGQETSLTT